MALRTPIVLSSGQREQLQSGDSLALPTDGSITFDEHASAPGTPAAGSVVLYAKADGKLYIKDDAGTETDLTAAGSGSEPNTQIVYGTGTGLDSSSTFIYNVSTGELTFAPAASGTPVDVTITAGASNGSSNGAGIIITGGAGGTVSGTADGGPVYITGGLGGNGQGGNIGIAGGDARNGTNSVGGPVAIQGGKGDGTGGGGVVVLTGGTSEGSTTGGAVSLLGGLNEGTGKGGPVSIAGGDGGATSGAGGDVLIEGGVVNTEGAGGAGGSIVIRGSAAFGSFAGGTVTLHGGSGTPDGYVRFLKSDAATEVARFDNTNLKLGTDIFVTFDEHATAPATPSTGNVALYAKADGFLYSKDDAGVETKLGGASVSEPSTQIVYGTGTGVDSSSTFIYNVTTGALLFQPAANATPGAVWLFAANGSGTNIDGGAISLQSGNATGTGISGSIDITGGSAASGTGGSVSITSGDGATPGSLSLYGGGATGNNDGGAILLQSGQSTGSGAGGNISLTTANGGDTGGDSGSVNIGTGQGIGTNAGAGGVFITTGNATGSGSGGSFTVTLGSTSTGLGGGISLIAGASNSSPGSVSIYAGGTNSSTAGGAVTIRGGQSQSTGDGGQATFGGGDGGSTGGTGGATLIRAGDGQAGNGGNITVSAGDGVGTNRSGGIVILEGGAATGSGTPGYVLFRKTDATTELARFDNSGVKLGVDVGVTFDEHASAPATPSTGNVVLYAKADGFLYSKDDAGTETKLASTTVSEPSNQIVYGTGTGIDSSSTFTYNVTTGALSFAPTASTSPGDISISAANATTTGTGGDLTLRAGSGGTVSGGAGHIYLYGGVGAADSPAGNVYLYGGNSLASSAQIGGTVQLVGGDGDGLSSGGQVVLTGGKSFSIVDGGGVVLTGGPAWGTGNGGTVQINGGTGGITSGNGGEVQIWGGTPNVGNGGNILMFGNDGSGTNKNGGFLRLAGGAATGSGTPGYVSFFKTDRATEIARFDNNGLTMGVDASITFDEHASAPGTPATGKVVIYAKADGKMYRKDDTGTETELGGGTGSGAPTTAQYVTLATDATLSNERVLAITANQLTLTDGGAGGNATLAIASNAVLPGTGSVTVPIGTTAQRTAAADGLLRFNTDEDILEAAGAHPAGSFSTYGMLQRSVLNYRKRIALRDEFMTQITATTGVHTVGDLGWSQTGSGTSASAIQASETDHPGIVRLVSGGTSGNRAGMHLGTAASSSVVMANQVEYFAFLFRIPTITTMSFKCGLLQDVANVTQGQSGTNGVWFEFFPAASSALRFYTRSGSTSSTPTSTVTVAGNTWYLAEAFFDGTTWTPRVNGTNYTGIATNVPTTAVNIGIYIETLTTGARNVDLDYFAFMSREMGNRY